VNPGKRIAAEPWPAHASPPEIAAVPDGPVIPMRLPGSSPAGTMRVGDSLKRRCWQLEPECLCASARRRTGLADFGSPSLEPALPVLTRSLEREAGLHLLGGFLMRTHLRGLLETRLRLAEQWRRQAEAPAGTPVRRPLFITGMPRSGSTFLHELLAEDPGHRAPRFWEVMFPIAPAGSRGLDFRIRKAAACLWWFRRLAPGADSVLPLRARTPHECVAIHSYSFLSEEFISTCRIPTYEGFLRIADHRPAYVWQRRFLQHLQLGGPVRRWVLKSPDHVRHLEDLFTVFPDALLIQTHRDPREVLPSLCRLTEVLHGLFARPVNRQLIRARESRILGDSLENTMSFRENHPELADRFIDVQYAELVSDPLTVVRRVYRKFDIPFTGTAGRRMESLAGARGRYRTRRARNRREDFGIDPLEEPRFKQYYARFGFNRQTPLPT